MTEENRTSLGGLHAIENYRSAINMRLSNSSPQEGEEISSMDIITTD